MTTVEDIKGWLERGKLLNAAYMLVVCDTYDWEDYPVYVQAGENLATKAESHHFQNMQKVMECYDLSMDINKQLTGGTRVWNGWRP